MAHIVKFLKRILVLLLSLFPARLSALSILMYHSVSDSGAFFAVSPKEFERQMLYIKKRRLDTIFASEIPARLQSGRVEDTVCVSFDDGYEDVYTNAYPILKSFGIKATVFLITDQIGGSYKNSEGKILPLLNSGQIEEMRASGLIEFAPHGHTHRKLHGLDEFDREEEIVLSRDIVKDITGTAPEVFAYPRGRTTPGIARLLQRLGFSSALGVAPGLVTRKSDPYNLPRNAVDNHTGFQEFKLKLSDKVEWYNNIARLFR